MSDGVARLQAAESTSSHQRIEELAAVVCIYGREAFAQLEHEDDRVLQALDALESGHTFAATRLTAGLDVLEATVTLEARASETAREGTAKVHVTFQMPRDYPDRDLLRVRVQCPLLPTDAEAQLNSHATRAATACTGRPALYEVCEATREWVAEWLHSCHGCRGGPWSPLARSEPCARLAAEEAYCRRSMGTLAERGACDVSGRAVAPVSSLVGKRNLSLPDLASEDTVRSGSTATRPDSVAETEEGPVEDTPFVLLLRLDHMRDRARYLGTVRQWFGGLGLGGRVLFHGRRVLILLTGAESDLKRYLVLHRSGLVDVDSRGQPCRERMMDVLFQGAKTGPGPDLEGFGVVEARSVGEIEAALAPSGLSHFATVGLTHV